MELELVCVTSDKYPDLKAIILSEKDSQTDLELIEYYGNYIYKYWDIPDTDNMLKLEAGSFYVKGRVPFHQEDAFTLGLRVGDML